MNWTGYAFRTTPLALAALGLVFTGGPVFAQTQQEITVEAPHVVRQEVGRSSIGAPVELVTLTRRVSYAGLDLTRHADVDELDARINQTAKQACDQINTLFPLDPTEPVSDCIKAAVKSARDQEMAAIAASGHR